MKMTGCWALIFPAVFFNAGVLAGAADNSAALAEFSLGMKAFAQSDWAGAATHLKNAGPRLPLVHDYIAFHLAAAKANLNDYSGALKEVAGVRQARTPISPLAGKATLLEAQAWLRTDQPQEAIRVLREEFDSLPQPDGAMALATAYEARGEPAQAAALYQRVYFHHPATEAAEKASEAIERLKKSLGADYPRPAPAELLARGEAWLAAKEYWKAKEEFQNLDSQLEDPEKSQARVGRGAADFLNGDYRQAYDYLHKLHVPHSESDARRLYYVSECARKTKDDPKMLEAVHELEKLYPQSDWRLKALVSAGDRDEALYKSAYESFPSSQATAYAHWKFTWDAYTKRSPEAAGLLREQVSRYPADSKASSALYFLGRIAERSGDRATARAYYTQITSAFPNYYYGVLAAEKLRDPATSTVAASPKAAEWLSALPFPEPVDLSGEKPNEITRARIERAHLLKAAGFPDWAEFELRFGADTDGQRHLLAVEIARNDATPALALRHMKALTPEYLSLNFDRAPREFWQFLFPMPYRESLIKSAEARNIDPYLMAGLIRQESEFNPAVVSPADARGLTQLLPSTGSMMARKQGLAKFSEERLFDPDVNLRLGTLYLRMQLDRWSGSLERTLAAYNAGPGRVQQWIRTYSFRDPEEFVENIPFNETREYVQAVLRNAAMYRRLYGGKPNGAKPTLQASNTVRSKNVAKPVPAHKPAAKKS